MIIFCSLLSLHIPLFVKIAINAPNSFSPLALWGDLWNASNNSPKSFWSPLLQRLLLRQANDHKFRVSLFPKSHLMLSSLCVWPTAASCFSNCHLTAPAVAFLCVFQIHSMYFCVYFNNSTWMSEFSNCHLTAAAVALSSNSDVGWLFEYRLRKFFPLKIQKYNQVAGCSKIDPSRPGALGGNWKVFTLDERLS